MEEYLGIFISGLSTLISKLVYSCGLKYIIRSFRLKDCVAVSYLKVSLLKYFLLKLSFLILADKYKSIY